MFLGQFRHNLDDKGRLTIPSRFRELLLADGAYLMQGFDNNLIVAPLATFDIWVRQLDEESLTNPSARLLRRTFFAMAVQAEFDKVGRILVPQFLRQAAGLLAEAVITGNGDYFEIWSPEVWAKQVEALQDVPANTQRFAPFNITSR